MRTPRISCARESSLTRESPEVLYSQFFVTLTSFLGYGADSRTVKDALKRGKRFHIVHYDWFEFSTVQEKRLPEMEYSMRNILAKQNASKREQARIDKGKRDGEKFVNTSALLLIQLPCTMCDPN